MLRMSPTTLAPSCPESARPSCPESARLAAHRRWAPARGEAVRQGPSTAGGAAQAPGGVSLPFTMVYCAAPLFRLFHCFCNWGIVGGLASLRNSYPINYLNQRFFYLLFRQTQRLSSIYKRAAALAPNGDTLDT